MRGVAALIAPLGVALRGVSLAAMLAAMAALCGGRGTWRTSLALILHLEVIFVLESLCTTLLLGITRPDSLEAAQGLNLRAGLDLFWQPTSQTLRAGIASVNAFTVWWGVLLVLGVSRLLQVRSWHAAALVSPIWFLAIGVRFLLQPH